MKTTTRRHIAPRVFGQTKCKAKILTHQVSGHRDVSANCKNQLSNPEVRIERIPEDIIDVDVPPVMEEVVEVVKHIPMMEEYMEGVKPIPHDEVLKLTVKKIVAVPVPRIRKETGEVIQHFPQERIFDRVVGHIISGTHRRRYESRHSMVRKRTQRSRCPFHKTRKKVVGVTHFIL